MNGVHDRTDAERAFREKWLKGEIQRIKAGGTIRLRCVMATSDRMALGLCWGEIPDDRAHRGADTCSKECQADRKRLVRWENAKGSCRFCGHNLPRTRKKKATDGIPETGLSDEEPLLQE